MGPSLVHREFYSTQCLVWAQARIFSVVGDSVLEIPTELSLLLCTNIRGRSGGKTSNQGQYMIDQACNVHNTRVNSMKKVL